MKKILSSITEPSDLQKLSKEQLKELSLEIKEHLITSVSKTGGHLGPNLGVVELTIAIHAIFNSPKDTIIFDTGHQSYVHKILTGRQDFTNLRKKDGISGYPSRKESAHDILENTHASAGLSWAWGIASAKALEGDDSWTVVIVGDGALTGGMSFEALNNIAGDTKKEDELRFSKIKNFLKFKNTIFVQKEKSKRLIIIVNDNGRSYAPTIGGLSLNLSSLKNNSFYEDFMKISRYKMLKKGSFGQFVYRSLRGVKRAFKAVVAPQPIFEDLGLKYIGPVDGHSINDLQKTLEQAKKVNDPVIVHVITKKGNGYAPALKNDNDHFHAIGKIHPETGLPFVQKRYGWTNIFSEEILKNAQLNKKLIGITAAMLEPVGFSEFKKKFPNRVFDVGIAEQHAVAFAAGLSNRGFKPIVAIYSSFFNRAFDQALMDVCLHNEPVVFVLDRAGITGDDGASHNGQWDLPLFRIMPNIKVAAPRDEKTMRVVLNQAFNEKSCPTAVRYPKGEPKKEIKTLETIGSNEQIIFDNFNKASEINKKNNKLKILIISIGSFADLAIETAKILSKRGFLVKVVDPVWVLPVSKSLIEYAKNFNFVATLEDGLITGGVGEAITTKISNLNSHSYGIYSEFLRTGTVEQLKEYFGLTPKKLAQDFEKRASINL